MGTRGFITFAVDGTEKTAYNHFDSYPDGLGLDVLHWLREAVKSPAKLGADVRSLRVVDNNSKPSQEDIVRLKPFTNLSVSTSSTDDWYCLLRDTQGNPAAMLAAGIIEDAHDFPLDSLFAEWGYVIDLDGDGMFEVYEGFQKSQHSRGRFASRYPSRYEGVQYYYPVALKARWPLTALPGDETFLAETETQDD
jgi:hypothetical protein